MKIIIVSTLFCLTVLPVTLSAQTSTYSQRVGADTFVSSGQPDSNFGGLGAMEIAVPTASQPRTEMSLMMFDTSAMRAGFNAEYGAGNWAVTGVALRLFSNFSVAGQQPNNGSFNRIAAGGFEFDLLGNNNWNESSITWNTMSSILPGANNNSLTSLGAFNWAAAGAAASTWSLNTAQPLIDEIEAGGEVTILGQPTAGSTVGFLFNTLNANPGYLDVTVAPVPEPATVALAIGLLCAAGCSRFFRWILPRSAVPLMSEFEAGSAPIHPGGVCFPPSMRPRQTRPAVSRAKQECRRLRWVSPAGENQRRFLQCSGFHFAFGH